MPENEELNKRIEFDITIDKGTLYDFLVYHAYSTSTGLIGTCFGSLGILGFISSNCENFLFLILGLVLIVYTPVSLKLQASKTVQLNPVYKNPLHYVIDENGITVSQGETTTTAGWDQCRKAVSTRLSILVYTGKKNASIFPRKQLGDRLTAVLAVMANYIEPSKMRVKY